MSREILFRGKRTNNGEWVEGWVTSQFKKHTEGELLTRIQSNIFGVGEHLVDTETVGEYTGLTDKNGKKIFEGDIVKCRDLYNDIEFTAVVEFGNPNGTYSWGWQLYPISGDTYVNLDILLWIETEETGVLAEVIGNIQDNPELLEVSE